MLTIACAKFVAKRLQLTEILQSQPVRMRLGFVELHRRPDDRELCPLALCTIADIDVGEESPRSSKCCDTNIRL